MAFGVVKVLSGDFGKDSSSGNIGNYLDNYFHLPVQGKWRKEKIHISQVESVEVLNRGDDTAAKDVASLAFTGALIAGPIGLAAGLLGLRKDAVTVAIKFKDSRKLLASIENKSYNEIIGAKYKWD